MAPGVFHQVVATHEALVTKWAPEFLLTRVGAVVASQLVGAGELLAAVGPGTWERPFSYNTQRKGKSLITQGDGNITSGHTFFLNTPHLNMFFRTYKQLEFSIDFRYGSLLQRGSEVRYKILIMTCYLLFLVWLH